LAIFDSSFNDVLNNIGESIDKKFLRPTDDEKTGRKWKPYEVMQCIFRNFHQLKDYTFTANSLEQALSKIVEYKINDFIISYSHETQKAFGLMQSYLK